MFRRAWWTRRRIAVATVAVVLLAVAFAWECGTDEVRDGQPLDEAKAALQRAGAVDSTKNCGMFMSAGGHYEVNCSMWELPDGRTLYLTATRESDEEPFRVYAFHMWQGWPKHHGTVELPEAESVRLRRSAFAVVPAWLR